TVVNEDRRTGTSRMIAAHVDLVRQVRQLVGRVAMHRDGARYANVYPPRTVKLRDVDVLRHMTLEVRRFGDFDDAHAGTARPARCEQGDPVAELGLGFGQPVRAPLAAAIPLDRQTPATEMCDVHSGKLL